MTEDNAPPSPSDKPVEDLIKELSYIHKVLLLHAVESEIISQIFKQVRPLVPLLAVFFMS